MGAEEARDFSASLQMILEKKLALSTVALRMGALRFLYKKILRRRGIDIGGRDSLIEAAPNLHHRTLLMLLHATGLRRTKAVG